MFALDSLMEFSALGWRDAILAAAVVVAIYLALLVLRLVRLRRPRQVVTSVPAQSPTQADQAEMPESVPPVPAESFGEQLAARVALDTELQQLREEVGALRREVAELNAARRVSPQYSDAMALARRGFDARGIADECGISVGEAELVLALSRDGANFKDEVDDGGNTRPAEPFGR